MEYLCIPSEITWECDPSLNRKFTNILCAPVKFSPKTVLTQYFVWVLTVDPLPEKCRIPHVWHLGSESLRLWDILDF